MSGLADDVARYTQTTEGHPAYTPTRVVRAPAPTGWEPGVRYERGQRIITTPPSPALEGEQEWRALIATMQGPLPAGWQVELVEARYDPAAWHRDQPGDDAVTRPVWRYRFRVYHSAVDESAADVAALAQEIAGHKPQRQPAPAGDSHMGVLLCDWQIGKCDGDGLTGTVRRVLTMIDRVERRTHELRKAGRALGSLTVFCGGDLVEGCDGFYPMQTFTVEADRRDQVKIARRLLRDALIRWAPLFDRITVTGVAGNHGENRRDGKAFTTLADNDDVALLEQVAEVLDGRSAYDHIGFVIPTDDLAVTLNVGGTTVALTHGHVARTPGATPEAKLRRWYEQQAGGKRSPGDATLLLTAHYHHFAAADWGGCLWLQGPTLDGGSRWYTDTTGRSARQGTLTFTLHPEEFVRDIAIV